MRALLSVATRDGITVFARGLQTLDVELFATDGTREHLAQDGVEVEPVAELTGVPAMLDGQVKTFHHAIYAGILARRDQPQQLEELKTRASSRSTSSSSTCGRSARRSGGRWSGSTRRSR